MRLIIEIAKAVQAIAGAVPAVIKLFRRKAHYTARHKRESKRTL